MNVKTVLPSVQISSPPPALQRNLHDSILMRSILISSLRKSCPTYWHGDYINGNIQFILTRGGDSQNTSN